MKRAAAIAAVALTFAACAAAAQAAAPFGITEASAQFPFRSYVLTLHGSSRTPSVSVTENGASVPDVAVVPASSAKRGNFGVVLVIDASDSMTGRPIAAAVAAARAFVGRRAATTQLGVITFNARPHVLLPLSTDARKIGVALTRTPKLAYGTHIYDAVGRALRMLRLAHISSGSVVLLSDGADTGSTIDRSAVAAAAQRAHVRIFTVGFHSGAFDRGSLATLAARSGGSFAQAASATALEKIYGALGQRLSGEYLLQYRSLAGPNEHVTVRIAVDGILGSPFGYRTPPLPALSVKPYHASFLYRLWRSAALMVIVGLLCALLIGIAVSAVLRAPASSLQRRVAEFVTLYTPARGGATPRLEVPQRPTDPNAQPSRWARASEALVIAGITASLAQIVAGTAVATVIAVLGIALVSPAFGVFGLLVPLFVYNAAKSKLDRKRRLFAAQLPDTLQIVASALRSGHTIVGALAVVASESPEPTGSEMRRVVADEQLGVPLESALDRVAKRMASVEFEQVAVVAGLQREAGGNAAEVLERVADNVRDGIELRQLVRSLTAQGRLSRWILTLLPPGLAGIIAVLDPGYLSPLVDKSGGRAILIVAAVMVVVGSLAIKKIVNIKV